MDLKTRAELVMAFRQEIAEKSGSVREPRAGESMSEHMSRAGGGDAATADAAGRWDRRRARMPKPRRRRTSRWGGASNSSQEDYSGYRGWADQFNYSTPASGRQRVTKPRL